MNHLKSKKSRWSIWEFVDHIWIWEKFNNRRCIISTNIKASKRTLFGPLLCHRWASAERHKIQRRVMGTLAGTHLPKQGKETPCIIIVMHGSCRRDRSTAQRTKQPGHACNGHERTCIMYAPTHLTTKIWTLPEKRFISIGQIFCWGCWWWSRPYSDMLRNLETSRLYKWNSRGGWWYEPPLQMGRIYRGGSLTSRSRCFYL